MKLMKLPPLPTAPAPGRGSRIAVVALAFAAMAAGTPPGVAVHDPWMRSIIPSRPAAGYLTLTNDTGTGMTLVGASSPGCGMLMLHRSVSQGGQEAMMMVKSVALPAHGSVVFAPGGYHLMCMQPTDGVRPGGTVPVTLRFGNGDTLTATFPVRGATGK
jgi:copper(I)-binding protein